MRNRWFPVLAWIAFSYGWDLYGEGSLKPLSIEAICGPKALHYLTKLWNQKVSLEELIEKSNCSKNGSSMLDLSRAAKAIGLEAKGIRTDVTKLSSVKLPGIILIHNNHFVVLEKINKQYAKIVDPLFPPYQMTLEELQKIWKGEILLVSGKTPASRPAGELVASEPFYDAGEVMPGEVVSHQFTLYNWGTNDLSFDLLQTSCSCTSAKLSSETVPPGSNAILTVSVNTAGLLQQFEYSALFKTSDPLFLHVQFKLKGIINNSLQAIPNEVDFGQVVEGQEISRKIRLVLPLRSRSPILSFTNGLSHITYRLEEINEENIASLELKLNGQQPLGKFEDRLEVVAKSKENENHLIVPLKGKVLTGRYANPSILFMGVCKSGETKQETIRLESRTDTLFELVAITNLPTGLKVNCITLGKTNGFHLLNCEYKTPNQKGIIEKNFIVKLKTGDQFEDIKIPMVVKIE